MTSVALTTLAKARPHSLTSFLSRDTGTKDLNPPLLACDLLLSFLAPCLSCYVSLCLHAQAAQLENQALEV